MTPLLRLAAILALAVVAFLIGTVAPVWTIPFLCTGVLLIGAAILDLVP
jgi:hypothetical protein